MKWIENVDKEKYETFVKNHPKGHFLQAYAWGEFAKCEKHLTPHYVGLVDTKNKLHATALLLEKHLPLGYSYFYIPRGFVLDYRNQKLVREFTENIKKYVKEHKGIFFKIDPDIIYHEEDALGNVLKEKEDEVYLFLKSLGYKHLGFTKNFETMQPRYSFRIDLTESLEQIENRFSKTTKQRIKKAEDFDVKVEIGTKKDIKTFYNLMVLTENRKDFITHDEQYYQSLYSIWNKDNCCNLFIGSVDLTKIIAHQEEILKGLKEELENLPKENLSKSQNTKKQEVEKRKTKIEGDLVRYQTLAKEYPSPIVLSAHFIIEYGDKAWVLYAGNHNILTDTYTNYKTYQEHLRYCHDKKLKIYDQFGTIGDLRKENPLLGLHEFKKKFGGNYVEFIGEFDYVIHPIMYFVFTKLVPFYRNAVKKVAKKKREQ